MIVTDKLSTESFHAFIDEQLTDEEYVQVEAQLDAIPEKIEEIQQCHIINERLREVFDPIVEEPLPEDLYELAIYGLENQRQDVETVEQEEIDPISYLELEEDLAAIDSMDEYPEVVVGESLIDDTDAADLEVLAQTEHLSGFDIDELRSDSANIIPDIFDDTLSADQVAETPEVDETIQGGDPTDDLLESIDELSIELDKAHQTREEEPQQESQEAPDDVIELPAEVEPASEVTETLSGDIDSDNLELSPIDSEINPPAIEEASIEEALQSAQEKVLETLTPEEELSLEPLEEQTEAAFIQETEIPELEPVENEPVNENKATRPRNLRADQKKNEIHTPAEISAQNEAQDNLFDSQQIATENSNSLPPTAGQNNFGFDNAEAKNSGEVMPDDLVAEFFAENKGPDFEVNEVVKQFEEVSQDFHAMEDDHLFDDGSTAEFKHKIQRFFETARAKVEHYKHIINQKKSELLGKFGGGQLSTDFNKSPFDDSDFARSTSNAPADTLDLSAFEDLAKESATPNPKFSNEFTDDTSPLVEKPATVADGFADMNVAVDQSVGANELDQSDLFSGPGKTPASDFQADDLAVPAKPESKKPAAAQAEKDVIPEYVATTAPEFDLGLDLDDGSTNGNLVSKFGDTLRYYKQKIAEMRANQAQLGEADLGEETSAIDKYKNSVVTAISNIQLKNNPKMLAGAALVVGLVIVSLIVTVGGGAGDTISNQRIDKLAIDTHLLNTQFNTKMVADADSAIIEKLQWFSVRVGRQVRLGDIRVEGFDFKKVTVIPTMASFAAANVFENKSGQRVTLLAIPDVESTSESALSCRIPAEIDGLCVWVKDSVRYVAVANLSLSRVRSFSEQVIAKL